MSHVLCKVGRRSLLIVVSQGPGLMELSQTLQIAQGGDTGGSHINS